MCSSSYDKHAEIWDLPIIGMPHELAGRDGNREEIGAWAGLASKYGTRVLALMCATGRDAVAMAKKIKWKLDEKAKCPILAGLVMIV